MLRIEGDMYHVTDRVSHMRTRTFLSLGILFCLGVARVLAQTDVISVNLGGTVSTPRPDRQDVVGFVQAAGWTNVFGTPDVSGVALPFENGSRSGATISIQGGKGNRSAQVAVEPRDANTKMFNRGLGLRQSEETTVTVTGLPTDGSWAGGYEVYVYFAPDGNMPKLDTQSFSIACGDVVYQGKLNMRASNYSGQFVRLESTDPKAPGGGNYVLFTGLTGGTVTIRAKTDQTPNAILITGLQIFARPGGAPPTAK